MNMPKIERALKVDFDRSWREGDVFLVEEYMMVYVSAHGSSMCIGEDICNIASRRNAKTTRSQGEDCGFVRSPRRNLRYRRIYQGKVSHYISHPWERGAASAVSLRV